MARKSKPLSMLQIGLIGAAVLALVTYLAIIMGSSQALLRECAENDVRRREIQEIHDAAGAAVHLIARKASADARGDQELRAMEREHIVRVLAELHGNKLAAAKRLGISRRTLYRRLARHGLMAPAQVP